MSKLKKLINEPLMGYYFINSKLDRTRFFKAYFDLNRNNGIKSKYFLISFDCDTEKDADAAVVIHNRLKGMGVRSVFAVPGELIIKSHEKYKKIALDGGEFINHGYRIHTEWDNASNQYESTFFYDKTTKEAVKEDIVKGDKVIREILGLLPKGFRTPHFGTYQRRNELRYLHRVLRELNYSFSTSTVPYFGFRYGMAFNRFGITEIPVSGMWSEPLRILDSYSFYYTNFKNYNEDDYLREAGMIADVYSKPDACGLLNYYADPSHVFNKESFYDVVALFAETAKSVSFETLLSEIGDGR